MKLSQLIAATALAGAGLIGFAGVAHAAPAPTTTTTPAAESDPAACVDGALTVVIDDSGVQHQACVASAAASDTAIAPARATLVLPTQQTASTRTLPATGAGAGGLIIAALLVGSGSIVSLLSRRRPSGARKGFRRRNVTP